MTLTEKIKLKGLELGYAAVGISPEMCIRDRTYTVRAVSEDISELGENLPVTFKSGDLSFDIKFKPIETYDTVDEIGPTAMHNGISVTAVPRWDNDILYIKFYALNYSERCV